MKKYLLLFFILFFSSVGLFAQGGEINLIPSIDTTYTPHPGGKSLEAFPSASLIDGKIYLTYSESAPSIVSIIDVNTEEEVWYYEYGSTNQVIINLAAANITDGTYRLRVYIYGRWWWGEFVLEEEDD